jgi:hypothetical protein
MDSRELFDIINPFDRGRSDVLMSAVLKWVGIAVPPEYVYMQGQLNAWAMRNGWRLQDSDAELCALLRKAQAFVVVPSQLATDINDALVARRSING